MRPIGLEWLEMVAHEVVAEGGEVDADRIGGTRRIGSDHQPMPVSEQLLAARAKIVGVGVHLGLVDIELVEIECEIGGQPDGLLVARPFHDGGGGARPQGPDTVSGHGREAG